MNHLEKVEKLREKANVTYEEAKAALETCDWDILDAMILLESEGKIKTAEHSASCGVYSTDSTNDHQSEIFPVFPDPFSDENSESRGDRKPSGFFSRLGSLIKYLVKAGCDNGLIVRHKGEQIMDIPIIAVIILLMCFFWVIVPLMVLSLFFDFNYNFSGPNLGKEKVNQTMNRATTMASNFKNERTGDSGDQKENDR